MISLRTLRFFANSASKKRSRVCWAQAKD